MDFLVTLWQTLRIRFEGGLASWHNVNKALLRRILKTLLLLYFCLINNDLLVVQASVWKVSKIKLGERKSLLASF